MHHVRSGPSAFVEHRAPGREGRSLPPVGREERDDISIFVSCWVLIMAMPIILPVVPHKAVAEVSE